MKLFLTGVLRRGADSFPRYSCKSARFCAAELCRIVLLPHKYEITETSFDATGFAAYEQGQIDDFGEPAKMQKYR